MQKFSQNPSETSGKKIYKAKRRPGCPTPETIKLPVPKSKVIPVPSSQLNSPTPIKYPITNNTSNILSSQETQDLNSFEVCQVYGRRERQDPEIRETKKFKGNNNRIEHKYIYLYDPETKDTVGFKCIPDSLFTGVFSDNPEQEEDDCPTSSSQVLYCRDYLAKELEEAILNAS